MLPVAPTDFTLWASLGGAILIGLSAVMTMALYGRIAKIAGIISVTAVAGYRSAWRQPRPLLKPDFDILAPRQTGTRLLTGAALFGIGWRIGGFGPGPAWTAVAIGVPGTLVFVSAMVLGIVAQRLLKTAYTQQRSV